MFEELLLGQMRVHTQEFSTPCPLLDPLFEKITDLCQHSFAFFFVGFLWKEPLETEPSSIYCLSSLFFAQSSRLSFHVNCEDFLLMTTLITFHPTSAQVKLRSIEHVRKYNCVASNMCASTVHVIAPHPTPPPHHKNLA